MSQFARDRFRKDLAWENSEKHLLALYRGLLLNEPQRSHVSSAQPESAPLERARD